jgi:hypothetical protein
MAGTSSVPDETLPPPSLQSRTTMCLRTAFQLILSAAVIATSVARIHGQTTDPQTDFDRRSLIFDDDTLFSFTTYGSQHYSNPRFPKKDCVRECRTIFVVRITSANAAARIENSIFIVHL